MQRAAKALQHWNELHNLLLQHEETFRKRWIKKTISKRKQVLLAAWPNIPPSHRPDLGALLKESHEQRVAGTRFRSDYLFPYINLEDLCRAKNILLLLHCRGHNQPHVFASFDLKTQQLGRRSTALQPGFMEDYVMLTSAEHYGEMVPLDSDSTRESLFRVTPQPGDGLLLLEIQSTLLQFLLRCAKAVLHDSPTPQNLPTAPLDIFDAEWPSVVDQVAEIPYRLPVECDISRMQSLVNGKVSEAEDHIWALREDPGYFQECVHDWSEHDPASLVDSNGKRSTDSEFWHRILSFVVTEAYQNLVTWHWLKEELFRAAALRPSSTSPDPMPWYYEQTLRRVRFLVKEMRTESVDGFMSGIFSSVPLRQFFVREPSTDPETSSILRRDSVPYPADSPQLGRFFKLLGFLWDPVSLEVIGLPEILDELELVTH